MDISLCYLLYKSTDHISVVIKPWYEARVVPGAGWCPSAWCSNFRVVHCPHITLTPIHMSSYILKECKCVWRFNENRKCGFPGGAHQPGEVTSGWCTVLISPWHQPICLHIFLHQVNRLCFRSHGLSQEIAEKFPRSDMYSTHRGEGSRNLVVLEDIPGTT